MEDPFTGGPRGIDQTVIDTFPVIIYDATHGKKECRGMNVCVICLAVFKEDEMLRSMPKCGHVFHSNCVDSWLQTHSTCPCCRASLVPGSGRFFSRVCWPSW
ncbi:RING-H2 finger protein ATL39 [Bienertia sinuspersici]